MLRISTSNSFESSAPGFELATVMGKVHGSLTHCGKVRKATKKVDKTVKRARPRGRAMKRLKVRYIVTPYFHWHSPFILFLALSPHQYNKRFVSIKMVNGRPARPNTQPPGKLG